MWLVLMVVLLSTLGLSLLVAWFAAGRNSWQLMLLAALFSLIFSGAAALSIGPYSIILTNLTLTSAIGIRWRLKWIGWTITLTIAVAVWLLTVPMQLLIFHWPKLGLLELLFISVVMIATLVGPRSSGLEPSSHQP
ncbi:MAG: hypothetical protein WBW04_02515 [Nitrolancea sp.]